MGATARTMTMDLDGVEAQARDISFLIGYARTLSDADVSEVAVAGFSWGGISNLFAAARDNRIDALVALDGSMRYFAGLVKQSGYVHPGDMTAPLLFFTQGEISLENIERNHSGPLQLGPSVLNQWTHGDLITVHDLALIHQEHSSMYQRNEDTWKDFAHDRKGDYTRADGVIGYVWISRYTLHFLDAYLKHDAIALAWLKKTPAENGAPPHLIATDFRPANGLPASYEALRIEVGKQGFDHLAAIYAAMQKEKSDFKPGEEFLHDWSTDLVLEARLSEAIDVLKLACQLYPESSDGLESLGAAYMNSGQKQLAIDAFNKALELDPENGDLLEKLKSLQSIKSLIR
jgi:pimeloyl-ACP methyl ester carboxylesterase